MKAITDDSRFVEAAAIRDRIATDLAAVEEAVQSAGREVERLREGRMTPKGDLLTAYLEGEEPAELASAGDRLRDATTKRIRAQNALNEASRRVALARFNASVEHFRSRATEIARVRDQVDAAVRALAAAHDAFAAIGADGEAQGFDREALQQEFGGTLYRPRAQWSHHAFRDELQVRITEAESRGRKKVA